jgi:hypothetical protein
MTPLPLWTDKKDHNYALFRWVGENAHCELEVVNRPGGQGAE